MAAGVSRLTRIFIFAPREFCCRISTRESRASNVERNVLDSAYTCGGKWHKLKHLKLVYIFDSILGIHPAALSASKARARTEN